MKKLLLIMLIASPCLAGGPKYSFDDPHLNDELTNVYKDISTGKIGTRNIKGTTTTDSASSGNVGEYMANHVQGIAAGTSTQFKTITSISLTAGDWDVSGSLEETLSASTPSGVGGIYISLFPDNTNTDMYEGDNTLYFLPPTATNIASSDSIASLRISVAATTTVYLKGSATFSAGTPQFNGRLSARRVR